MNERLKKLAEQAGFNQMGIWKIIGIDEYHERFAELVRQDEREACAKLCEFESDNFLRDNELERNDGALYCAEAIRARGEK